MQKSYLLFNEETKHDDYVKEKDVIDGLYMGKYSLPSLYDNELNALKREISKINNKIPMYDVYTENLYLINKENLFNVVFEHYYRFPTTKLVNQLLEKQKDNKKYLAEKKDVLIMRENKKITLIKKFMDCFDNQVLLQTYINALYDTDMLGRSISLCRNPSFIPSFQHIRPYFTKKEQECVGLNNKIIKKEDDKQLTDKQLRDICEYLNSYVLNAQNIVNHHNYIIQQNLSGMIQYYSMQGSYILNEYLRNESIEKSDYLDEIVRKLSNAIYNSPKFDKDIYLYRFIEQDFLGDIKIGGTYSDKGFMSCTRDQFYKLNKDNNTFGWNLMKIKLPKEFSALCIETISQFPNEQEVILPPNTVLKLQSKNSKNIYYHPNKNVQDKLNTIYEFVIVEEPKEYKVQKKNTKEIIPIVDFKYPKEAFNNKKINTYSNRDTIIHFIIDKTNSFNLFKTKIGSRYYTLIAEEYNSLSTYKPFYAKQTDNGFCIYSIDNESNSLLFNIEISENIMYINYNVRYDNNKVRTIISDDDFIEFICKIALYFNVQKVIYYCDYVYCNSIISDIKDSSAVNISSSFCYDIYHYLKTGTKRFKENNDFKPSPVFTYEMLDILKDVDVNEILKKKTTNERDNRLYYIYEGEYLIDGKNNCKDFFIWIVENKCGYIDDFIDCLKNIEEYKEFNPFANDYYVFYPVQYLKDKGIIKHNPYINIYSKQEIVDDITRFSNKNLARFRVNNEHSYRRKNKLVLNNKYVSLLYLYN